MFQLSIPFRLMALSSLLVAVIVGSNFYLSARLSQNTRVLTADAQLVENLRTAIDASKSFGDLKYWLLELGVDARARTEEKVLAAQQELGEKLDQLELFDAEAVAVLRLEVGALMDSTLIAIESYNTDNPGLGDSFLAKGLEHIWVVDRRLSGLVNNLEAEMAATRNAALDDARRAVDGSILTMVLSTALAIALTWLVVRSITAPLKRLMSAMSAITGGRLDTEIPPAGADEIGAMTRTLTMFRDNLAERQRLMEETQRAEATKRQAQALLGDAIETISEGFALFDADDRLVLSNSRYHELLYGDAQLPSARGDTFEAIIRRAVSRDLIVDARGREEQWLEERLAKHGKPSEPHVHQRIDGRWIQVSERKTHEGGTVAVYMDITALKNHEQELAEVIRLKDVALRELHAVLDNIKYGVLFMDEELRIRMTNRAYRDIWGIPESFYTPERTLVEDMQRTRDLGLYDYPGEWEDYLAARLAAIRAGNVEPVEFRLGNGKQLQYQCISLPDGGRMLTYFDITELKRTEEALRESEERYALAVRGSHDGLWDWDTQSDRIYVSPRLLEITGLDPSIEYLTTPDLEPLVHPEDRRRHVEAMRAHLRGETGSFSSEARLLREDGGHHWVLTRGIGLRDENGRVYRMAGSLTDITARKETEIAMREAKEQAEAATRTKSQFLANVSHELRTPLNAVIGLAEMLKEEAEEGDDRELVEPLQRIVSAGRHLLRLINDLLDLSKIEAGRLGLHVEDFQIGNMLKDVTTTASALAGKNQNRLEVRCDDELGIMHSDSTRVCQVLLNLLSNAFKFTERGTVVLDLQRVEVDDEDWLSVKVIDDGSGMSEEQMSKLFQEFMPTDSPTTRRHGGAGLGLAISRRLCRLLGGDIQVQSELGSGTTFTVRLPMMAPEASQPA